MVIEPLCVVAGVVSGVAVTVFLLAALWSWQIGPRACSDFGDAIKVPTKHKFLGGCFVTMPDGNVLPEDVAKDVMRQKFGFEINKGQ